MQALLFAKRSAGYLFVVVMLFGLFLPGWAQSDDPANNPANSPASVVVGGETVFTLERHMGPYRSDVRAKNIAERIEKAVDNQEMDPKNLKILEKDDSVDITVGDIVLTTVTTGDALASGKDMLELAHDRLSAIKTAIEKGKAKRNVEHFIQQVQPDNVNATVLRFLSDPMSLNLLTAIVGLLLLALVAYLTKRSFQGYFQDSSQRYTFSKVIEFTAYFLALVLVTVVFRDALGNLAVILGAATAGFAFALKEVIVGLAGWVAVSFGNLYKVGDRVQLGGIRGDVIDIGFGRTTLMELGEWVDGDLYTGRIVRVSNGVVFQDPLFNYSRDLPFLWDEIVLDVKYGSDLDASRQLLDQAVQATVGEYAQEAKLHWQRVKNKYLLEDEKIDPFVTLVLTSSAMQFTVRYPVDYRERRSVKDKLYVEIMKRIEKSSDKVKVG
ncbi:MAG: mechanosensitive ion channel family protein [Candidatus Obscuribacterales bacterium]|nr:mechanosensitive ion channel family protein [Candidatus Obscuribacterales bacterium]